MVRPSYRGGVLFEPLVEEFSFTHGADCLVGDLVLPPWPGPHPTVVLVEGSGPGGRTPGTWPTRLAAAGLASLAYDKPGSGQSSGDWTRQTLHERAEETAAALRALHGRGELIADRVALLGSSQGGWVAHLVPARAPAVAAVVTISGPGVGVVAQERYRLRRQLPAEGFSDRDVAQALALLDDQLDRAAAGEDPRAIHAAHARWRAAGWYPLLAATTPASIAFLAAIADHDPAAVLAGLRCPCWRSSALMICWSRSNPASGPSPPCCVPAATRTTRSWSSRTPITASRSPPATARPTPAAATPWPASPPPATPNSSSPGCGTGSAPTSTIPADTARTATLGSRPSRSPRPEAASRPHHHPAVEQQLVIETPSHATYGSLLSVMGLAGRVW